MKATPELTLGRNGAGYVTIKFQGKWMGHHIYVWEQANGPIPRGEDGRRIGHVHHRPIEDGGKGKECNDISNLIYLSDAEHIALHMKKRADKVKELLPRKKWRRSQTVDGHWSDEHNAKTSAALMGHEVSKETREKISQACKGHKLSAETKAKMVAGQVARRAREHEALLKNKP